MQTARSLSERKAQSRRVTTVVKPGPTLRWTHGTASGTCLLSLTKKVGRLATADSSSTQPMPVRRGNGKPADGGTRSMPSTSSIRKRGGLLAIWGPCFIQQTGRETWVQQAPRYFHEMIKGIFFLDEDKRDGLSVGPGSFFIRKMVD